MFSSIDFSPDEVRAFLTLQRFQVEACIPLWKECQENALRKPPLVCADVEQLVSEEARQRKFLNDHSLDIKNSKVPENLQSEALQLVLEASQSVRHVIRWRSMKVGKEGIGRS